MMEQKQKKLRKGGKNTQNYTKQLLITQLTTMMWWITYSQMSWNVKSSGSWEALQQKWCNSIHYKGLMLKLKLQYFGHLMWRADSLEKTLNLGKIEGRRKSGQLRMRWASPTAQHVKNWPAMQETQEMQVRPLGWEDPLEKEMDEMVGWHHWLNGHEDGQTLGDGEGQGSLACYSP